MKRLNYKVLYPNIFLLHYQTKQKFHNFKITSEPSVSSVNKQFVSLSNRALRFSRLSCVRGYSEPAVAPAPVSVCGRAKQLVTARGAPSHAT